MHADVLTYVAEQKINGKKQKQDLLSSSVHCS